MGLTRRIVSRLLTCPRRTAVIDDQRTYSYAKLILGAFYVARLIRQTTGNRHVGIMLPTSGAFPIALLACWLNRRVAVPLNYLLNKDELAHVIADSGIDTILTAGRMLDFLGEDAVPESIQLIRLEEHTPHFTGLPPLRLPPNPPADELACLLYTSGTSGKPKGVMLSFGNLEAEVDAAITHARIDRCTGFLGVLPQFHSFGLTVMTLIPLIVGAQVIYTARFIPKKLFMLMAKHKPSIFVAVPSMYGALLTAKNARPEDVASLTMAISGAEPLPPTVAKGWKDRLGINLLEGYGLTETSPGTNWSTPWASRPGSVGLPLPGVRNFIIDDDGQVLGPDQTGEILIAGPIVMLGYYHRDDLTDQVITHLTPPGESQPVRVFKTGDIGHIDTDGYLYITGRKKEMLIIGGENVFPREIEDVLNEHPAVGACAVVGRADDTRGEVPIAFIERADADAADPFDPAALRHFLRERLAPFKVPREIHAIEALPRNPTGKILRRQLKELDPPPPGSPRKFPPRDRREWAAPGSPRNFSPHGRA